MVSYPRAELAIVCIGNIEIEGLMLEDGSFGMTSKQISLVLLDNSPTNTYKKRLIEISRTKIGQKLIPNGLEFKGKVQVKSTSQGGTPYVDVLELSMFEKLLRVADKLGNEKASDLLDILSGLSLQQLFSDAFCVQFEKEERQQWLKDRQTGKIVRRTLTDAIRDYLKAHNASANAFTFTYTNVTNAINRAIFNRRSAKQLKEDWGVENPRDHMNQNELLLIMEVEHLTMRLIDKD